MNYQKLFNYLSGLGITLLESDMQEIERIVLESQTVIKCKALRKKGTDLFYYGTPQDCSLSKYPDLYSLKASVNSYTPADAELIDIEIHIPE